MECISGLGSAALVEVGQPGWTLRFLAEDSGAPPNPVNNRNGRPQVEDVRLVSSADTTAESTPREDLDLPRCTMALYEVVVAQGRRPRYNIETLSQNPPEFEAVL